MHTILSRLGNEILFFDGAMGTTLQKKGLPTGELPELWDILKPEVIREIHRSYLQVGCTVLKTNTFGANRFKLMESGHSVQEIVQEGVKLAKEAAAPYSAAVALDVGPTGKLLAPIGDLEFEDAIAAYREIMSAGVQVGADCILIETMSDLYEIKSAVIAAKEGAPSLPVFVTMTVNEQGKLLTGADLETAAAVLEGLRVDAIGLNCGLGPQPMVSLVQQLRRATSLPILVNPNAGLPREEDGRTVYDVEPDEFSKTMVEIIYAGANAVGGCCGTTPKHLFETVARCQALPSPVIKQQKRTVVASGNRSARFGGRPVIIGERINPTGKPKFKQALREENLSYILQEGIVQQDNGADILDVNVGLPEIDEPKMMCRVLRELQAVTELPLQIDTSDPKTMADAMRIYNGKPLVNSVTAKEASMHSVFPLIQKYGGVVIGLTITEGGIPETAQGRLEAARKIIDTAAEYGIGKEDIIIDPLTMAVSAGQDSALVTLEALRQIHAELGVCTSLGVSNISFGLPQRETVTSAFFLMALQSGLNAAIMNPNSDIMMRAYRSYCALCGFDNNCMNFIAAYSQSKENVVSKTMPGYSLFSSIEKGLKEAAAEAAAALAQTTSSLEIIDQEIIPALDSVGEKFEKGVLFLPQLLMSAEAAKAAFDVIRAKLDPSKQEVSQKCLTIVIATVKGDVHDIGKNIVKVLLENYGFAVIDLGKDVASENILETVKRENAELVGLSALMTTTVASMKETIDLLKREVPHCKIMVGGAVLNQEYADLIGADFYGKDAMASVRYASEIEKELSGKS